MKRVRGFTLVELLVVIAIIAILAAIAVPRVSQYIAGAQLARAVSDINAVNTSVTGILSDSQRRDLRSVLAPGIFAAANSAGSIEAAAEIYTDAMYTILRQGREAGPQYLAEDVRTRLAASYLDLGQDPWGQPYLFFIGPIRRDQNMPFRAYRVASEQDGLRYPMVYNDEAKSLLDRTEVPGNPQPDGAYGIPADRTLPIYVWSRGADAISQQGFVPGGTAFDEKLGGGDDVNNWDKGQGWKMWY